MGYETELQITGVTIDKKCLQLFRTYVEKNKGNDSRPFHYMLQHLYLETNEHGYLDWNLSKDQKKRLESLSAERPVPIHSIDFDKVDFVFVNFGVEGESVGNSTRAMRSSSGSRRIAWADKSLRSAAKATGI
jgi:hypothetical protein